ncbi:MAG: dTMP kinase [Gammaproteobacteria bacterium]|nr:dTMP kinase [Gammaproteobacteria bacterium]
MNTIRGKFITVEGVEGAGKSTQLSYIESYLRQAGKPLVVTREPGGTPLGEEIREILLQPRADGMADETELLLMFAARAEHLSQKILPALENGKWVLCDRFTDATYAYQGGGRGLDKSLILDLENLIQGHHRPDLTIFLDLPVEAGLERARQRGELDRFETEDIAFFERVRQAYLDRARLLPEIYRVIDASYTIDEVKHQVNKVLDIFLSHNE